MLKAESGSAATVRIGRHNKRHPYGYDNPHRCLDKIWSFSKRKNAAGHGCDDKRRNQGKERSKARNLAGNAGIYYIFHNFDIFRHEKGLRSTSLSPQRHKKRAVFYWDKLLETGHLSTSVPTGKQELSGRLYFSALMLPFLC